MTVLKNSPFNLPWGSNVFAKIVATNIYDDSGTSQAGYGAIITTYPDPPVNLIEYYDQRSPTTLGLTWNQADFNGGAVIIDYSISIAVLG